MGNGISRRDFLNGVALAVGAKLAAGCSGPRPEQLSPAAAPSRASATSVQATEPASPWQGSTDADLAAAHALRDGHTYSVSSLPIAETVDLVVVGAGISGLAAAYYYRQRHPEARILILDNHDEFGGHARRCEMHVDGRLVLGYGGSESLQAPAGQWSRGALSLLEQLGVRLKRFEDCFDRALYPSLGLSRGVLFTREAFGVDKLVTGDPTRVIADDIPRDKLNARTVEAFVRDFPLPTASRAKLIALYTQSRDVLVDMTPAQKRARLMRLSYRAFLIQHWGLDEASANVFQKRSHDYFALGVDAVSALDAAASGYPGFAGLDLSLDPRAQAALDEPYIYHFPDGNASIARLLVRKLLPKVAPGNSMEDVVTARFDTSFLDHADSPTRLRLRSTVVAIAGARSGRVEVTYVRAGAPQRVAARAVVAAGYHSMLPYVMQELGAPQRDALRGCVRAPLVYAKVALRNWQPWAALGVHEVTNPMGFFSRIKLDYPVSMGSYRFPRTPAEPIGLHLVHVPTPAGQGLDQRAAWRAGREILYGTPYQRFEANVRDELTRILGRGGFDAQRDMAAIHIYRWGHGYACSPNSLFDTPAPELPQLVRQQVGQVALAGSDAAREPDVQSAIDEAARAVAELG